MGELFEVIDGALDEALAVEWDHRDSDELAAALEAVERLRRRVEALDLTVLGSFDASAAWAAEGHRNSTGWLRAHHRARRATAATDVRVARRLRRMPHTATALADGELSRAHVDVLSRARRDEVADEFAEAEPALVDHARTLRFESFERKVRYFSDDADPDRALADHQQRIDQRSLHVSKTFDEMTRLDGWLDPLSAAEFSTELERLEQRGFDDDWARARGEHGDAATVAHLPRSPAQRRADALVEMARRSAATPIDQDGRPPTYVVNLVMDWPTYLSELAAHQGLDAERTVTTWDCSLHELEDGTVLPPSAILPQALAGRVRRIVFGPDGHVLDFGRTKRLFDGGLREALILRDRVCQFPGCGLPARRCEADHRLSWGRDGPTSERNGRMYCKFHNLLKEIRERSSPATGCCDSDQQPRPDPRRQP